MNTINITSIHCHLRQLHKNVSWLTGLAPNNSFEPTDSFLWFCRKYEVSSQGVRGNIWRQVKGYVSMHSPSVTVGELWIVIFQKIGNFRTNPGIGFEHVHLSFKINTNWRILRYNPHPTQENWERVSAQLIKHRALVNRTPKLLLHLKKSFSSNKT